MLSYRLTYFSYKGLAELSRYIFGASGTEFEDFRIEFSDFPKYKEKTIFGQLPILEITDENGTVVKLAQSNTIARFLARRFNLAGKTDIEQAKAEMIIDHFSDLHTLFKQAYYETNKQLKAEKTKKFSEEDLPLCISFLEKLLEQQNSQYLVGNELTVADLCLASNVDRFESAYTFDIHEILEKYPLVKAVNQRVNNNPNLKAYKKNAPFAPY